MAMRGEVEKKINCSYFHNCLVVEGVHKSRIALLLR